MATAVAKFEIGDSSTVDDLIGSGGDQLLARKYVLLAGETVVRGEVVGVITSGGRVKGAASGNGDGSETPFGIVAADSDATGGSPDVDGEVLVYVRGTFNENALILGSGLTVAGIREGLRDKGIYLETPVKRYP